VNVPAFESCIASGGVALFPADTVYGLATHPESSDGVARIYEMKGRPPARPAAVMFFDIDALPLLGSRTHEAVQRLLPGPLTVVVPNPGGLFPLACGPDPSLLGVRVPLLSGALEPLRAVSWPVLQTSANLSGGPDARRIEDVPESIRSSVDVVLDAGSLPGVPSTVVDLSRYESDGTWSVIREGAVPASELDL
jgi:L-threonylcarbamoyladenylate synthase